MKSSLSCWATPQLLQIIVNFIMRGKLMSIKELPSPAHLPCHLSEEASHLMMRSQAIKAILIKVNEHKYVRKTISLSFPVAMCKTFPPHALLPIPKRCGAQEGWRWVIRPSKYIKICANNNKTYEIIDIGCIKIATQCGRSSTHVSVGATEWDRERVGDREREKEADRSEVCCRVCLN